MDLLLRGLLARLGGLVGALAIAAGLHGYLLDHFVGFLLGRRALAAADVGFMVQGWGLDAGFLRLRCACHGLLLD